MCPMSSNELWVAQTCIYGSPTKTSTCDIFHQIEEKITKSFFPARRWLKLSVFYKQKHILIISIVAFITVTAISWRLIITYMNSVLLNTISRWVLSVYGLNLKYCSQDVKLVIMCGWKIPHHMVFQAGILISLLMIFM